MFKKKYRLISGVLCGALCIGLVAFAGCGNEAESNNTLTNTVGNGDSSTSPEPTSIPEPTAEPTATPTPEPTATPTPEPTATPSPEPTKVVNRHWENNADISWIDPEKPMVALSFDDGPVSPVNDNSSAIRIQNALADNGMHATFFYWGNSLNNNTKAELERAYELGFELGNHTKSHPDLSKLDKGKIEEEVAFIDGVLASITGQEQFLLRPPYLAVNQLAKDTINVPLISCGIDTQDWNNATTEEIIGKITKAVENGTLDGKIVLMHETYKTTAEAVEYLVPYLKEQGYQVVTISEMFKARGVDMNAGNVYTYCP